MTLKSSQATSRKFRSPHESLLKSGGYRTDGHCSEISFVDDTFTIIPGTAMAETLHQALDNAHLPVSFTIEVQVEGKLPFLGMMIIRKENTIHTEIYRKLTDTGLSQHYQNHMDKQYMRNLDSKRSSG